jgi:hypothetical protein
VEEGILERRPYSEHPPRDEYVLTEKGRELRLALTGLRQWGDRFLSEQPPRLLQRKSDGKPVMVAFVPEDAGNVLSEDELESVPGPGA